MKKDGANNQGAINPMASNTGNESSAGYLSKWLVPTPSTKQSYPIKPKVSKGSKKVDVDSVSDQDLYADLHDECQYIDHSLTYDRFDVIADSCVSAIASLHQWANLILKSSGDACTKRNVLRPGKVVAEYEVTPELRGIGVIKSQASKVIDSEVYTSPLVHLLVREVNFHLADDFSESRLALQIDSATGVTHGDSLNNLVRSFRILAKDAGFRGALANWRGKQVARCKSLSKYVNKLFEDYSKILVVRVDLHLGKMSIPILKQKPEAGLKQIEYLLKRFFNNQRHNKLFEHKIGYIVKIEYAPQRGFHVHCAFFFDGHQCQNDSYYSNAIGWYWVNQITGGHGTFYDCNRPKNKAKYKKLGIGLIHYADMEKRANLMLALAYLAKKDSHLTYEVTAKQKMLRMGQIKPKKSVGGRPRKWRGSDGDLGACAFSI